MFKIWKLGCYPDKISGSTDPNDQQADKVTLQKPNENLSIKHDEKKSKLDESDYDSEKNLKCK